MNLDRRLTAEPEQWDDSSTRTHGGDLGYDSTKWANDRVMEMPRATAYHPQSPKKFDLCEY